MEFIDFNSRKICFISSNKVILSDFPKGKYAVLIYADTETSIDWALVESLLSTNCTEFYCVGMLAEKTHDIIDTIIESQGLFEIVTTWAKEEILEDIVFYFLNIAGAKPATLLAITNGDKAIEEALKRAVANELH